MTYRLTVRGMPPVTQGSMQPVSDEFMRHSSVDLDGWRNLVGLVFNTTFGRIEPLDGPIAAGYVFYLPPFESVQREWPDKQSDGDLDKYVRGVNDALEGLAWTNDARVVQYLEPTMKLYARPGIDWDQLGVDVTWRALAEDF